MALITKHTLTQEDIDSVTIEGAINLIETGGCFEESFVGYEYSRVDGDKLVTLKAVYGDHYPVNFVLTFEADQGYLNLDVKLGAKLIKPEDPEIDGYEFLGWYIYNGDNEYTTQWDFVNDVAEGSTAIVAKLVRKESIYKSISEDGEDNLGEEDVVSFNNMACYVLSADYDENKLYLISREPLMDGWRFDEGGHTEGVDSQYLGTFEGYQDKTYKYEYATINNKLAQLEAENEEIDVILLDSTSYSNLIDVTTIRGPFWLAEDGEIIEGICFAKYVDNGGINVAPVDDNSIGARLVFVTDIYYNE